MIKSLSLDYKILREEGTDSRQYGVGLLSVALDDGEPFFINLQNYQINSTSTTYRFLHEISDDYESALSKHTKKLKDKLKRNRVIHSEFSMVSFESILDLVKHLCLESEFKLSSVNGKKLKATITNKMVELASLSKTSFEERIEAEIEDIKSKEELEKIGKETSLSNSNWGLF